MEPHFFLRKAISLCAPVTICSSAEAPNCLSFSQPQRRYYRGKVQLDLCCVSLVAGGLTAQVAACCSLVSPYPGDPIFKSANRAMTSNSCLLKLRRRLIRDVGDVNMLTRNNQTLYWVRYGSELSCLLPECQHRWRRRRWPAFLTTSSSGLRTNYGIGKPRETSGRCKVLLGTATTQGLHLRLPCELNGLYCRWCWCAKRSTRP